MGSDSCMTEILVTSLRAFVNEHPNIMFPHRHNFYQIVYFTQGGGSHSIDFKRYEVKPYQVYYMSPGQVHTWDFDGDTDGYIVNFNESFFTSICHNPNFVRDFPLFGSIDKVSVNELVPSLAIAVEAIMEQMLDEYKNAEEHIMDMLRGLLITLLVKLSRINPTSLDKNCSAHIQTLMRQFERLVEEYHHEKHLPKEYAEMMFITPNYLNALSNNYFNKSAGEVIRDRILLEAKRMLVNSDMLISQIAASLHFEDNAYFTRFFKKNLGVTPEGFRQANLQGSN